MNHLQKCRMKFAIVVLGAAVLGATSPSAFGQRPEFTDLKIPVAPLKSLPEGVEDLKAIQSQVNLVLRQVMPAVVNVKVGPSQGSGVVIDSEGTILTAGHVSGKPGRDVIVTFPDGKSVKGITLGSNRAVDNGMMKIVTPGTYPYLPMGKSTEVKAGDWVIAIGHPGGIKKERSPPVRVGRVTKALDDLIETDCTLVGGDSGGPLFNMAGQVVGIHSRIAQSVTANIHVPIDTYKRNWEWLVKEETWSGARLGFQADDNDRGCRVGNVDANSAADKAGLQVKDVIFRVAGRPVNGYEDLRNALSLYHAGDVVTLSVRRGDSTVELRATLGKSLN